MAAARLSLSLAALVISCGACQPPSSTRPVAAPLPLPDFLPTEVVYRPHLELACNETTPRIGPPEARPYWGGLGAVDESGRVVAWIEAIDSSSQKQPQEERVVTRRYVARVDDIDGGEHLHEVPLPELPGLMASGTCAAWRSAALTTHRRVFEDVDRVLSHYVFRRLHSNRNAEEPVETPESERRIAVELLRRSSDPGGDWSVLPRAARRGAHDERQPPGSLFVDSTAREEPVTSSPLTAALRCGSAWRFGLECVDPEQLVVFRSRTREVRLSRRLGAKKHEEILCTGGRITSLVGISPRRRLVVLSESVGIFAEEGDTDDVGCRGLRSAARYTVLRFDP